MKHPTLMIVSIAAGILTAGCGTHEVRRNTSGTLVGKGAEYYLPRTVLVTTVPVIKTTKSPGRFHFFSEVLLGREPSINAWNVSYRIGDELALETIGVRDPAQRFISIHPRGPFKTFNQSYKWNSEGVLTHGEATIEDKTIEFVVSTIEAGAKAASSVITPASEKSTRVVVNRPAVDQLLNYLRAVQPKLPVELDADVLNLGLRLLTGKIQGAELREEETGKLLDAWRRYEDSGGDAYREILAATKSANKVEALSETLTGVRDLSGREQVQKSLDSELAQFVGSKSEATWVGQFRYDLPDDKPKCSVQLFSVTNGTGFVWPNTKDVRKEMPEIKPSSEFMTARAVILDKTPWQRALKTFLGEELQEEPTVSAVTLNWDSISREDSATWDGIRKQREKHGWHYRITADSLVTVSVNGSTRLRRRVQVAQHGCVGFLPASGGGQKVTSNIDLDPTTGALIGVTHGATSFDPALVKRTGEAAGQIITAEKAAEKARAATNDPVAQLERRKALLQLKKDISALEDNE